MNKIRQITIIILILFSVFCAEISEATALLPGLTLHKEKDSVVVLEVTRGSKTWDAGIRTGDILLKIDDQEIKTLDDYVKKTKSTSSDETVTLIFLRHGEEYVIVKDGNNFQGGQPEIRLQPQKTTNNSNTSGSGFDNNPKAMYKIPLSAGLDEVLEWCNKNSVEITNSSEHDIEKSVRKQSSRLKLITKELKIEEASLSEIEREVTRMAYGGKDASDILESMLLQQIQETLDISHNPSFIYDEKKYYFSPVFESIELNIDGLKVECTVDGVTKSTYELTLTPTDKSSKLKKQGVSYIVIYFYNDLDGVQKSYAALAGYSFMDRDEASNYYSLIYKTLDEKYGPHNYTSDEKTGKVYWGFLNNLTGYNEYLACLNWRENIFLLAELGEIRNSEKLYLRDESFALLYLEPLLAQKVYKTRVTALDQCERAYYQNKNSLKETMKDEF